MSTELYRVELTALSQRYFIKDFQRKYKAKWTITLKALREQFARIESLLDNGRTRTPIKRSEDGRRLLIKHDFAVAGMHQSPHGSGSRAIICVDRELTTVHVLLVYHKTDLADGDETAQWQRLVRTGCPELVAGLL